ncbi:MAG TPA: NAD(P)-binding domain-containing protein, partial [Vicinamibacterales bacterium]
MTTALLAAELKRQIGTTQVRAGVIGLGYVGLPLAVEFARAGYEVVGLDIDTRKVDAIADGRSYIPDVSDADVAQLVASGVLRATTDFDAIARLDTVNICV